MNKYLRWPQCPEKFRLHLMKYFQMRLSEQIHAPCHPLPGRSRRCGGRRQTDEQVFVCKLSRTKELLAAALLGRVPSQTPVFSRIGSHRRDADERDGSGLVQDLRVVDLVCNVGGTLWFADHRGLRLDDCTVASNSFNSQTFQVQTDWRQKPYLLVGCRRSLLIFHKSSCILSLVQYKMYSSLQFQRLAFLESALGKKLPSDRKSLQISRLHFFCIN